MNRRLRQVVLISLVTAAVVAPSTAYATHLFGDVPDESPHADGIAYVDAAGITHGCDDQGNYCPAQPVTRDQMATFLFRASGNDPATAPSVNADTVDGLDSSELQGAPGTQGPAGPAGPPGAAGGFGTLYNASTFTLTSDGCAEHEYRVAVVRQFGTQLPWEPSPCAAIQTSPSPDNPDARVSGTATSSATPPSGIFFIDTAHLDSSSDTTFFACGLSRGNAAPTAVCTAFVHPGDAAGLEALLAGHPESSPVIMYQLP
jgi:hypothetical protein